MKRKILKISFFFMLVLLSIFFIYFNNTYFVHASTNSFYSQLKDTLAKRGFSNNVIVVSTKRLKIHNDLLVKYSSAAKESSHLIGNAIDFIVFDINKDGKANEVDIDIVFEILDKEIIKNKGGIGTYKNESSFISKQMIHIDARGHKARWAY